MYLLKDLNEPQKQAVCYLEGPLLVLAGPGSGKTRVITHRIAYLISQDVFPSRILALTFTNKAAKEMTSRVEKLTTTKLSSWISTFHAFCARILRKECSLLGYTPDYSIYDSEDQKRAVKQVLENLKIEPKVTVDDILFDIRKYKNKCITPDKIPPSKNYWAQVFVKIYQAYQDFLKQNNAFDFDDLLLKTLELFHNYKNVLEFYQDKFLYILIDEFQDTNLPQYRIAKLLAQKHYNICATGDPDQSIYSWRGANIQNILTFEKDFPNTTTIKLEQNYRTTGYILDGASAVISKNKLRKYKELWTENPKGYKIKIFETFDDYEESEIICRSILRQKSQGISLNDIVIFYRMNAQSRAIESALRNNNIPYVIIGGVEFYKRAEIKNILAYLRIMVNENDDLSLMRIINIPPRGIGKVTCARLIQTAAKNNMSILKTIRNESLMKTFSTRVRNSLKKLLAVLDSTKEKDFPKLSSLVINLLEKTGYGEYIQKKDRSREEEKYANIEEFIASVVEYEKQFFDTTLSHFLERISLIADTDKLSTEETDKITLMTLHSSKGLEFSYVYITGMSEGLLPHRRSLNEGNIEEERRLFFVGMTRAKTLLTVSYSKLSYRHGSYDMANQPSRFLAEIPSEATEWISKFRKRNFEY